jgi:hypothetical protein
MTIAEQNEKLLALIGDRQMTAQELEAAGACLIINGLAPNLRGRLDKLVADGRLRKVKLGRERKPQGSAQFGPRKCLLAFERVKEEV